MGNVSVCPVRGRRKGKGCIWAGKCEEAPVWNRNALSAKRQELAWRAFTMADILDITVLGHSLHRPLCQAEGPLNFIGILLRVGGRKLVSVAISRQSWRKREKAKKDARQGKNQTTEHGFEKCLLNQEKGLLFCPLVTVHCFAHFQNTTFSKSLMKVTGSVN